MFQGFGLKLGLIRALGAFRFLGLCLNMGFGVGVFGVSGLQEGDKVSGFWQKFLGLGLTASDHRHVGSGISGFDKGM